MPAISEVLNTAWVQQLMPPVAALRMLCDAYDLQVILARGLGNGYFQSSLLLEQS